MKKYSVAMYERLSRDDGETVASNSIRTQKLMLEDYCRARGELATYGHYSDDGYSGVTFERPAFKAMIADMEAGRVDCVVVKDLSRFGRDYIGVGEYIERVFPRMGVRFIAINDKIDSEGGAYNVMLPFANLFNASYAADISRKVKSAIATRQHSGRFTGPSAPFGYVRDPNDRGRLIISPAEAKTVMLAFELYLSGLGKTAIAGELNRRGLPCPSESRAARGFFKVGHNQPSACWTCNSVNRLLCNPVYAGSLPCSKTRTAGINGKTKLRPICKCNIVSDTHEGIIPRAQWQAAQAQLRARASADFHGAAPMGLFCGLIYCGDCGCRHKALNSHGATVYVCSRNRASGAAACSPHRIREDALTAAVLSDVNRMAQAQGFREMCAEACAQSSKETKAKIDKLSSALPALLKAKQAAYEQYRGGKTSKEAYLEKRRGAEARIAHIEASIAEIQNSRMRGIPPWLQAVAQTGAIAALDRETVLSVVSRITVFADGSAEIEYRWGE